MAAPAGGAPLTLEDLQESLRADGADLVVEGMEAGVARFRLVIVDPGCNDECILPREHLERLLSTTLRQTHPEITSVEVVDPREDSTVRETGRPPSGES